MCFTPSIVCRYRCVVFHVHFHLSNFSISTYFLFHSSSCYLFRFSFPSRYVSAITITMKTAATKIECCKFGGGQCGYCNKQWPSIDLNFKKYDNTNAITNFVCFYSKYYELRNFSILLECSIKYNRFIKTKILVTCNFPSSYNYCQSFLKPQFVSDKFFWEKKNTEFILWLILRVCHIVVNMEQSFSMEGKKHYEITSVSFSLFDLCKTRKKLLNLTISKFN